MTTMTCVHASNLLNDAAFKAGEEYQCYRDENKKVFVVDNNGFHIELQSGFTGLMVNQYGAYRMIKVHIILNVIKY
ncbi:hypothetical protein ACRYKS_23075 [Escherichia coli]|uniref:hypothetical protein n=1 Tax=Escherichia coli TaxID=562 RepID=UPI003D92EED6